MRICVLIASGSARASAGARIRYDRLQPALSDLGCTLQVHAIPEGAPPDADVYLFSKCHDIRAPVLARKLKARGASIAIDVFDDYYSPDLGGTFAHLQHWFFQMRSHSDALLCASPHMTQRLKALAPQLPVHMMRDPAADWQTRQVADRLKENRARALRTNIAEIGWFGIGDNPYFDLGLSDVTQYADVLTRCRAAGFTPRLTLLTNRRAMTADRLAALTRLPVPFTLDEWSAEKEKALVARSLLCFLPVSDQSFSRTKSLNRAITVLTGGAQALTAGYPLYAPLEAFTYSDPQELLEDVRDGQARVHPGRLDALSEALDTLGSARTEAARLVTFFRTLDAPQPHAEPLTLVVSGSRAAADALKGAQEHNALLAKGPFAKGKHAWDLQIKRDGQTHKPVLQFSKAARRAMTPAARARLQKDRLPLADPLPVAPCEQGALLVRYMRDMKSFCALIEPFFQNADILIAEQAAPFPPTVQPLARSQEEAHGQ